MTTTTLKGLVAPILAVLMLSACSDRMSDAEQKMADIRNQPAAPVEALPAPQPVEDFVYSAGSLRSPFLAYSLINKQTQVEQNTGIQPDLSRTKQPMEAYELAELVYMGRIVAPNGRAYGLVQLPDGLIREVQVGEYMGKNDGRILEITPTQINLEEIVPDGRAGFVYKRTPLITPN